ncbi:hypothetical protein P8C59_005183 [Phyllachora maydis]|uniref:Integrase catalytic domain-containing protein n=1 Tax=Phyllachora maydis TaxID=1825666 RepID=A0AAD9I4B5_9PEZI|nr:hypothetical protein P8C59_005183 [Phyllachora maydis]
MADQAKGKGIAPKRASNPADPGQSSRPPLPIRTLLEDKEDGEDYSEVIEFLKQNIKSHNRVIASQSSDIKTLLLSLNTLKTSVEDSVSAIKNISSTLASLTNSSNAAATRKTSYSPRFDPFSGTIDLDSPPRPPRKEPYLGPAVDNTATSNLDPPIDIGSKEGFKDTITSSIVKELSKKAYTIPDDSKLSRESNFEQWIQALTVLLMLLCDSLSSGPRAAISWIHIPSKAFKLLVRQYSRPIESKKEDVYNEFHALTFSTYKKGLSAFNAEFNGYLAKLTMAKIDIDPSLILNQNPVIEAYRAAYVANSSNSTPNSNSNPSKKGKNKKKGKKKASYNVKGQNYSAKSAEQASFILGSYNLAIEEEEESDSSSNSMVEIPSNSIRKEDYRPIIEDAIVSEAIEPNKRYKLRNSPAKGTTLEVIEGNKVVEKAISSPTLKEPNIGQRDYYNLLNLAKLWHVRLGHIGLRLLKKTSSITKGLPNFDEIKEADFHCSSCDRGKAVRRVSKALIPDLPRVLDSIEGDTVKIRPRPYNRNPIVLLLVDRKSRYRWVFNLPNKSGPIVANAIKGFFRGLRNGFGRYPTKFHFDGGTEITDLLTTWLAKRGIKFSTSAPYIHEQNGLVERSCFILEAIVELVNSTAITNKETTSFQALFDELEPEGELVDLDLDLEGAVSPDPSNLNTEKPISIEIGPSKLEPYESSSDSELDEPSPDKPINPVIVESTRPTISIRKPELPEPITNEPLDNSNLISKGDKMQLDYYKLLAKTSSYILSFIYKARKRVISKDSTPTTYKQVLKLPRDERSKWLEAITKEFIQLLELGVFKFLPRSLLPSNLARGFILVEGLDYTETYASTNIPPTWRILLAIGVFYNAKTCHFIVTYIDDCLFIGPNIGYITDLKKRLNKSQYIEEAVSRFNLADSKPISIPLQPGLVSQLQLKEDIASHLCNSTEIKLYQSLVGTAMYIMLLTRYLNSTKDYSICFSYNGNTVADLGPKLCNSSNTTTKLSRDFHSKEGPRPLTTTSTTIVDSRNSKGSSRTSIINSSLVPIGFSDSDFAGDKATSKSTYGYLYKLAGRPISWKTKRATTIALSTLEAETDGLTEAIREVQWIIGLFSKLHRPIDYPITLYRDNQGSITVANDPALHARTKHTLLKFRYVREQVKAKIVTIIYLNTNNIKTLLLSLNTLKASIKDSVSAIKNISSTLACLTNSSNAAAATTGKTSYSPRFNPFSGTIDLDSPPRPPRKEPYLGPAVNSATSNLDPPIDTGSKEGFKDTITSSIVKELSEKAYTIPDDSKLSGESNFEQQYSRPIESKKEDVYNEFHAFTFSTYRKGLSAFNAEFNGYLAKLTMAKIDIDPSLILNQNPAIEAYRAAYMANSSNSTPNSNSNPSKKGKNKKKALKGYKKRKDFKGKGLKTFSNNKVKCKDNQPRRRPRDPALYNSWLYDTGSTDHISNSKERFTTFTPNTGQLRPINTGNGPVSPAGIGSIILEVLSRKAPPTYTKLVLDNVLYLPNIDINIVSRVRYYNSGGCLIKETLYRGNRRCIAVLDFKKSGFFLDVKGSSKPILHANFAFPLGLSSYTTKSIKLQRNKIVVEIPSNSIRKEDYRPIIEDAIVSEAIEPNKRYKLRNSPAKGTTLEGIGPSLRGKRPYRPIEPLATA